MAEVKSVENIATGKIDIYGIGLCFYFMGFVGLWIYYEYFNLGIELLLKVAFWWFVIYSSVVGFCIVWKNFVASLDFVAEDYWRINWNEILYNFLKPIIVLALLSTSTYYIRIYIQDNNPFLAIVAWMTLLGAIVEHFRFYNKHLQKL